MKTLSVIEVVLNISIFIHGCQCYYHQVRKCARHFELVVDCQLLNLMGTCALVNDVVAAADDVTMGPEFSLSRRHSTKTGLVDRDEISTH